MAYSLTPFSSFIRPLNSSKRCYPSVATRVISQARKSVPRSSLLHQLRQKCQGRSYRLFRTSTHKVTCLISLRHDPSISREWSWKFGACGLWNGGSALRLPLRSNGSRVLHQSRHLKTEKEQEKGKGGGIGSVSSSSEKSGRCFEIVVGHSSCNPASRSC